LLETLYRHETSTEMVLVR